MSKKFYESGAKGVMIFISLALCFCVNNFILPVHSFQSSTISLSSSGSILSKSAFDSQDNNINYDRKSIILHKRPNRRRRQPPSSTSTTETSNNEDSLLTSTGEIPKNLMRKVNAKRSALGHVVPYSARQKQKKQQNKQSGGYNSPQLQPQGKRREMNLNNPSNLKILGGFLKGRKLQSPQEVYLRPMMGKVREAVYSTFTSFGLYQTTSTDSKTAPNTRHLDIFAGSGSVGLESLSRGASHCTFVDLANDCCQTIHRNIELLIETSPNADSITTNVVQCDVYQALTNPNQHGIEGLFDIITLCPPYEEIVYGDLLEAVANSPLLKEDTIVLIEYPVELGMLPHVLDRNCVVGNNKGNEEEGTFDKNLQEQNTRGKLIGVRNRKYGRTVIAMYICNPTGVLELAHSRPEEFIDF